MRHGTGEAETRAWISEWSRQCAWPSSAAINRARHWRLTSQFNLALSGVASRGETVIIRQYLEDCQQKSPWSQANDRRVREATGRHCNGRIESTLAGAKSGSFPSTDAPVERPLTTCTAVCSTSWIMSCGFWCSTRTTPAPMCSKKSNAPTDIHAWWAITALHKFRDQTNKSCRPPSSTWVVILYFMAVPLFVDNSVAISCWPLNCIA